MKTSDKFDQVAVSLVAAQREWPKFVKSAKARIEHQGGGSHQIAYLPLDELLAGVTPRLHEVGLTVMQEPAMAPGMIGVSTIIVHISGQFIQFDPVLLPAGQGAQASGSALSYARRYALLTALGIAAEDDDGVQASRPPAGVGEAKAGPGGVVTVSGKVTGGPPYPITDDRAGFWSEVEAAAQGRPLGPLIARAIGRAVPAKDTLANLSDAELAQVVAASRMGQGEGEGY